MTIKQAIARLQNLKSMEEFDLCTFIGVWYEGIKDDYDQAIDMAIEALQKKTERKTPNYYGDGYSDGYMVYDSAECPSCGYIYEEDDGVWGEPYCPHCGQALDWDIGGEEDD